MPPRDEPITLSPAEWEIMKIFWEHGPLAARDVYAQLPKKRGWAYKTVKTLLSRLVAKEALAYDQVGNSYLYRPVVDRDRMTRQEVRIAYFHSVLEAYLDRSARSQTAAR